MGVVRFLTRRVLNSLGWEMRRAPPPSAAKVIRTGDPITYEYMPRVRGSAVFDIKIEEARGLHPIGLQFRSDMHPFVRAALAARNSRTEAEALEILRTELSDYYQKVCPQSALEAVDLEEDNAPGLRGIPATGYLFPWVDSSIAENLRRRQIGLEEDALQYGKMVPNSEGYTPFGPVGSEKLTFEVARLHSLIGSIAENGFAPLMDPMRVVGLRKDKSYRWLIMQGEHRFAVCAALSIKSVPARVLDVVRREDCEYWPQVVSGNYSHKGALAHFDRLYDGVPARVCESWMRRNSHRSGVAPQSEPLFSD